MPWAISARSTLRAKHEPMVKTDAPGAMRKPGAKEGKTTPPSERGSPCPGKFLCLLASAFLNASSPSSVMPRLPGFAPWLARNRDARVNEGRSAAFRMPAGHAGETSLHHPQVVLPAGGARLAAWRIEVDDLGPRVGFQPQPLALDEPDGDEVALDHAADGGEDRGDIFPVHPGPAAGVEDRLQLLDDEGHVPAAPEHRRDHPRQRHGPGEMLHVLRVDEHLEGPPMAMQHDIVHRDIDRMVAVGPFQLVGRALKFGGPVQRLGHIDDLSALLGHLSAGLS